MTGDESKLAFVSFCSSIPVFFIGFAAGSLSDIVDRRRLLIVAQLLYFAGATYLAYATWRGLVNYFQIVLVALLLGVVAAFEMPARQSIVSRVVDSRDLATAIPVTAMTYNGARIIGPVIGTWILSLFGVAMCYFLNGISFLALVWVVMLIKADLSPVRRGKEPIKDVLFEGVIYTLKDVRLRTLFLLETVTGLAGMFFLGILPAITGESLGLDRIGPQAAKVGLGIATTSIGLGSIVGLFLMTSLTQTPHRHLVIKWSITIMGFAIIALSFVRSAPASYPLFAILGFSVMLQFNTTNALFQILAPEKRKGRVLAMHIWTLNGLSPFGVLFFGWIAKISHSWGVTNVPNWGPFRVPTNIEGPSIALLIGGIIVLFCALAAWLSKNGLKNLTPDLAHGWQGEPDFVSN